jgi:hypothetical protein
VYIHLNQGASEYARKSPCIFTLNQIHNGIFTEFPCPFLTVWVDVGTGTRVWWRFVGMYGNSRKKDFGQRIS